MSLSIASKNMIQLVQAMQASELTFDIEFRIVYDNDNDFGLVVQSNKYMGGYVVTIENEESMWDYRNAESTQLESLDSVIEFLQMYLEI